MTITTVQGFMVPPQSVTTGYSLANLTLDASGEKLAWIVRAPKTGAIRSVGFLIGTVVTSATDTDVRIETVDATTGDPSGSLWAANTNATLASGSITTNTWVSSGSFTADASVTEGDIFAIVVAPSGSPNYTIRSVNTSESNGFPYADLYTVSWAKQSSQPNVAVVYSDGSTSYMPGVYPISAVGTHAYSSSSTPDEYALKFSFPAPVRLQGAWANIDTDENCDVVLYDSDGSTALATASLDKDIRRDNANRAMFVRFPSSVTLSASTYYYLSIKPTTTTNITIAYFDVASAALFDQISVGQTMHYASRTDAGAWSATTTRRLLAGVIIDGIDDGAGGGSGGEGPLVGGRLVR